MCLYEVFNNNYFVKHLQTTFISSKTVIDQLEAADCRCFYRCSKKFPNIHRKTPVLNLFLIKLQACKFSKKRLLQLSSYEYSDIFTKRDHWMSIDHLLTNSDHWMSKLFSPNELLLHSLTPNYQSNQFLWNKSWNFHSINICFKF